MTVSLESMNKKIGVSLTREEAIELLQKMCLSCEPSTNPDEIKVGLIMKNIWPYSSSHSSSDHHSAYSARHPS